MALTVNQVVSLVAIHSIIHGIGGVFLVATSFYVNYSSAIINSYLAANACLLVLGCKSFRNLISFTNFLIIFFTYSFNVLCSNISKRWIMQVLRNTHVAHRSFQHYSRDIVLYRILPVLCQFHFRRLFLLHRYRMLGRFGLPTHNLARYRRTFVGVPPVVVHIRLAFVETCQDFKVLPSRPSMSHKSLRAKSSALSNSLPTSVSALHSPVSKEKEKVP